MRSGSPASISSPTTPAGPSRRSSPPVIRSGWPRSPSPTATPRATCRPEEFKPNWGAGPGREPGARRGAVRRPGRRRQGRLRQRLRFFVDPAVIRGAVLRLAGARPGVRKAAECHGRRGAAVTPPLRTRAHADRMGAGDAFFDISWAYRLRDTIPGTTRVVTVDGARSLPDERPWTWYRTWSSTGRSRPGRDRAAGSALCPSPRPVRGRRGRI